MVAVEGNSNAFLSHKGQLTKCALERIRRATPLEQISAGAWEEAIKDVIESVPPHEEAPVPEVGCDNILEEEDDDELRQLFEDTPQVPPEVPAPAASVAAPLTPAEVVAALTPHVANAPSGLASSRRSLPTPPTSVAHGGATPVVPAAAPATPLTMPTPSLMSQLAQASEPGRGRGDALMRGSIDRARSLDSTMRNRGEKRHASQSPGVLGDRGRPLPPPAPSQASAGGASEAFEAVKLSWEQLCSIASSSENVHPLLRLHAQAEMDRRAPFDMLETDHGSWDGRWSFLCEREWELQRELGLQLPCGDGAKEAMSVQASRKEYMTGGRCLQKIENFGVLLLLRRVGKCTWTTRRWRCLACGALQRCVANLLNAMSLGRS